MTIISEEILAKFNAWFAEASAHPEIKFAETMNLATCDAAGNISSRMVLLKDVSEKGFVFFYQLPKPQGQRYGGT